MNKKYLKTFASLSIIAIAPAAIAITTSCATTTNEKPKQDAEKIKNYILTKTIYVGINKETIKLTDFDQKDLIKISLKLNPNSDVSAIDKNEIEELIKSASVTFVGYLLPQLDKDSESKITLKINNALDVQVNIHDLKTPTNAPIQINPHLTADEIKQLIGKKLNEDLQFISSTNSFLTTALEQEYKALLEKPSMPSDPNDPSSPLVPNPNLNFANWWNANGVLFVQKEYTKYLYKTYPILFSETSKNINVNVHAIKTENSNEAGIQEDTTDPNNKKWIINIKISVTTYPLTASGSGTTITEAQIEQSSYRFDTKITIVKPKSTTN